MIATLAALLVLLFGIVFVLGWVVYGLLRQSGRALIRMESVEAALEDLLDASRSGGVFADRSLAKSRINRAGLAPGTPAPAFRLPTLDGREVALADYAGRRLLLVFSDPACGPCTALLPHLDRAARVARIPVLVVSRGGVEENRRKLAESSVTLPVALQAHWEISRLYAKFSTPIAYLIDEGGRIAAEVASGASQILALLQSEDPELRLDSQRGHAPGGQPVH